MHLPQRRALHSPADHLLCLLRGGHALLLHLEYHPLLHLLPLPLASGLLPLPPARRLLPPPRRPLRAGRPHLLLLRAAGRLRAPAGRLQPWLPAAVVLHRRSRLHQHQPHPLVLLRFGRRAARAVVRANRPAQGVLAQSASQCHSADERGSALFQDGAGPAVAAGHQHRRPPPPPARRRRALHQRPGGVPLQPARRRASRRHARHRRLRRAHRLLRPPSGAVQLAEGGPQHPRRRDAPRPHARAADGVLPAGGAAAAIAEEPGDDRRGGGGPERRARGRAA